MRTQEEYKAAYLKAFPETKDEEYETLWKKIDADGDGNLTVAELAKFYGFNVETGAAAEMDDEDILKMLQVPNKDRALESACRCVGTSAIPCALSQWCCPSL
tara:strand:- start:561 stop:866 length:306 start_codon:yes stop_codon:yes gene_type:complete